MKKKAKLRPAVLRTFRRRRVERSRSTPLLAPLRAFRSLILNRRIEAPSTPGRSLVSFNPGHITRKNIPSKWDDAEKWLIGSPCHESPAHVKKPTKMSRIYKQNDGVLQKDDAFSENQVRLMEYKVPSLTNTGLDGPYMSTGTNVAFSGASTHVLLKDKFTDNVESTYSNFRFLDPSKEGFLFRSSYLESLENCTAGSRSCSRGSSSTQRYRH